MAVAVQEDHNRLPWRSAALTRVAVAVQDVRNPLRLNRCRGKLDDRRGPRKRKKPQERASVSSTARNV